MNKSFWHQALQQMGDPLRLQPVSVFHDAQQDARCGTLSLERAGTWFKHSLDHCVTAALHWATPVVAFAGGGRAAFRKSGGNPVVGALGGTAAALGGTALAAAGVAVHCVAATACLVGASQDVACVGLREAGRAARVGARLAVEAGQAARAAFEDAWKSLASAS